MIHHEQTTGDTPRPVRPAARVVAAVAAAVALVPTLIVLWLVDLFQGGCADTVECFPGDTPGNPVPALMLVSAIAATGIGSLLCTALAATQEARRRLHHRLPVGVGVTVAVVVTWSLLGR